MNLSMSLKSKNKFYRQKFYIEKKQDNFCLQRPLDNRFRDNFDDHIIAILRFEKTNRRQIKLLLSFIYDQTRLVTYCCRLTERN